jgi:hypothetical protein
MPRDRGGVPRGCFKCVARRRQGKITKVFILPSFRDIAKRLAPRGAPRNDEMNRWKRGQWRAIF